MNEYEKIKFDNELDRQLMNIELEVKDIRRSAMANRVVDKDSLIWLKTYVSRLDDLFNKK